MTVVMAPAVRSVLHLSAQVVMVRAVHVNK
jgi:hypothetical protein